MNEEMLKIIVNQKRDIDGLHDYVDAGFKVICDWGKKDRKDIRFISFCVGVMFFVVYKQSSKINKLEKRIEKLEREEPEEVIADNDPLGQASAE